MKNTLSATAFLTRQAWKLAPGHATLIFAEMIARVLPRLTPVWVLFLLGGALDHNLTSVFIGSIGLAAGFGLASLMTSLGMHSRLVLMERMTHEFDYQVARMVGETPTLDLHENSAAGNTMQAVLDQMLSLGGALTS